MKKKTKKTKYQIALSSFNGISPQKYEIYDSEEEARGICNKYNLQDNNPYAQWIVIKREVLA